jgi:hypothetical protein
MSLHIFTVLRDRNLVKSSFFIIFPPFDSCEWSLYYEHLVVITFNVDCVTN